MDKIKAFFKKFKKVIIAFFVGVGSILVSIILIILYTVRNDNPTIDNSDIKDRKEDLDAGKTNGISDSDVDHWYNKFIGK